MRSAFIPVTSDFLSDKELEKIVTSNYKKINEFFDDKSWKLKILFKLEKLLKLIGILF